MNNPGKKDNLNNSGHKKTSLPLPHPIQNRGEVGRKFGRNNISPEENIYRQKVVYKIQ